MCVGWPMQILAPSEASAILATLPVAAPGPGDLADAATAEHCMLARGRGRIEHVDLRLVGPCVPGDWVLVYQGAARERLDAQRAAEIHAALDLLEQGLAGADDLADADPGFALPSAMSPAQLAALAGTGVAQAGSLPEHSPEPSFERP